MGGNKHVTCGICLRTMRGDTLKRHMKRHEKKPYSIDGVTGKIEYHSTVDDVAFENKIVRGGNEYQRKLELGRKIKQIVLKNQIPTASLDKDEKDALELFEKHGQVKSFEWRP